MLDFLKNIFNKQVPISEPEKAVEQSGFIAVEPTPTDYLAEEVDRVEYEVILEDGDWSKYNPVGERQNNPFVFDTKACVTFSALNVLEATLEYYLSEDLLPDITVRFLKENGYINEKGSVNFSDRFTAIKSKTSTNGNTLPKVADCIRNVGLIPEAMLTFGDAKVFAAYHEPSVITEAMERLATRFLNYFEVRYAWVFTDNKTGWIEESFEAMKKHLKHRPLQVAVPKPASHAVMASKVNDDKKKTWGLFNSYEPYFTGDSERTISYAFKLVIIPKDVSHLEEGRTVPSGLKRGARGLDVKVLQAKLNAFGNLSLVTDGVFGGLTEKALRDYQAKHALPATGEVDDTTRRLLNNERVELPIKIKKLEDLAEAIKWREGWFPGSRSQRTNNPGNLRYSKYQSGKSGGYSVFATYADGWKGLLYQLEIARNGKSSVYKPDDTLIQFFSKYAPEGDSNDPHKYAKDVAGRLGVSVDYKIKDFA